MYEVRPFGYSKIFERPLDLHLAFFRSVEEDATFGLELFRRLRGRDAVSALELQCGPGYYAATLSQRGLDTTAVDTRWDILQFAKELHPRSSATYRLQHPCAWMPGDRWDLLLFPLDSLAYLLEDRLVLAFLEGVRNALTEDGLLLIEANHPKDVGYIDYGAIFGGRDPKFPGVRVRAEWGVNQPCFDLVTHRVRTQIRITIDEQGRTRQRVIDSEEKQYLPRELQLLAERAALSLCGCYGGWIDTPLTWAHDLQVFALERRRDER